MSHQGWFDPSVPLGRLSRILGGMTSSERLPPFPQMDSSLGRVGRPGWDWHDDKKALRAGIKRVYVIGAGASTCDPYGLPTFKTLAQQLCNFLNEPERKIWTAVSTSRLQQIWLRLLACFGIGATLCQRCRF